MSRLKRLQTVEGVMDENAERAARAFGQAQAALEQAEQRLVQLQQFRADYHNRLAQGQGDTMDAFRLRDFNAFLVRIDGAIEQQHRQIEEARRQVEVARENWNTERSRAEAMGKVVQQEYRSEQRVAARREQNEADELAQRMFVHRNGMY